MEQQGHRVKANYAKLQMDWIQVSFQEESERETASRTHTRPNKQQVLTPDLMGANETNRKINYPGFNKTFFVSRCRLFPLYRETEMTVCQEFFTLLWQKPSCSRTHPHI